MKYKELVFYSISIVIAAFVGAMASYVWNEIIKIPSFWKWILLLLIFLLFCVAVIIIFIILTKRLQI